MRFGSLDTFWIEKRGGLDMKTRCNTKCGSAIMTVMIVITVIGMLVVAMVYSSSVRALRARQLGNKTRAIAIAEAGVAQTYSVLATNWILRYDNSAFPPSNYGGGTYDVTVQVPAANSNQAILISTGFFAGASASVAADLFNYGANNSSNTPPQGGLGPGADAFDYAMVSGGDMSFVGNMDMQMSNAWFHSNGALTGNGVQTIEGNVSSSTEIDFPNITGIADAPSVSGNVGTKKEGPVSPVIIPNIDLTPYYNAALAKGQVVNGNVSLSGNVTPVGGIMWVNGDISFDSGTFTGCFIATGNVNTGTGNGTYTFRPVNQYPTLVSRDGDMTWQGGNGSLMDFQGLVYLKTGSLDKSGNGDVHGLGTIIAAGGISKNGGWSGMLYQDSTPVPPGGGGTTNSPTDLIGVSAWYK